MCNVGKSLTRMGTFSNPDAHRSMIGLRITSKKNLNKDLFNIILYIIINN
jgi:hypothetical protein